MVDVPILQLPSAAGLALPAYASEGAAGMDVLAAEDRLLEPGDRAAIATGLALAVPPGFEMQVRARSGLALKDGIAVLNAPGTIDSDYRGEVRIILANLGDQPFHVTRGMRIAQLLLAPVTWVRWVETDTLDETKRGSGGFGSTGRQ
jgi:dUTP pyrophosphatase